MAREVVVLFQGTLTPEERKEAEAIIIPVHLAKAKLDLAQSLEAVITLAHTTLRSQFKERLSYTPETHIEFFNQVMVEKLGSWYTNKTGEGTIPEIVGCSIVAERSVYNLKMSPELLDILDCNFDINLSLADMGDSWIVEQANKISKGEY